MARLTWVLAAALAAPGAAAPSAGEAPETVRAVCAACHGADGLAQVEPGGDIPRLAGMNAEYLMRQLKAYAAGKRRDERMSAVVAALDPAEFGALAAWFAAQPPARAHGAPSPLTLSLPLPDMAALGRQIFEEGNSETGLPACSGCHQSDGRGNARFPRLAGQHAPYLLRQLQAYKSGRRATDPLMTAVGQRLSEREMQAVVRHVSALSGP